MTFPLSTLHGVSLSLGLSLVVGAAAAPQRVLPIRAGSAAAVAAPRGVVRVSVASDGSQANGTSTHSVITPDGRYVAFESSATNLVANDTNARTDVFVHDRSTGITTRESIASSGAEADANCYSARISSDGRFVTFLSFAANLVSGVSGQQIYVRDRQLGLTTVASVSTGGSPSNGSIDSYSISSDGRFVTFSTDASSLVSGQPDFEYSIFTRDRVSGTTTRDSMSPAGAAANGRNPSISDDGRYVAFRSNARSLLLGFFNTQAFVYDRSTGQTARASIGRSSAPLGTTRELSLSGDGRFLAFAANDSRFDIGLETLYLRDLQAGQTTIVVAASVSQPRLSSDGRFLSYDRTYNNANYVEFYDRSTDQVTTVSPGYVYSAVGGNSIAFDSGSTLVSGDTNSTFDIFVAPTGTDPGAPTPPANLAYTLAGSSLTLTWVAPTGAPISDYLIEAGLLSHSTDTANFLAGSTSTRFSTPFSGGGTYFVRVRAANAAGVSAPSNEITLEPLVLPGAPDNLTASVNGNTVTLTWSQATGRLVSYIIEAGSTPGGTNLATYNTGTTSTTLTASGLAPGTYFVRVRAASLGGVGIASNEVSFTIGSGCQAPAPPTNLTRSVVGSSVTLTWTAALGATSYVLEAGSSSGRADLASFDLNAAATTYVATGVPVGTYFVRARSTNSCGVSGASNEAVVIVSAPR